MHESLTWRLKELELHRAHTLRGRSIWDSTAACDMQQWQNRHNVYCWSLPIILGQLCACAKSTWPNKWVWSIGICRQKSTICDTRGWCRTIWSTLRLVFRRFWGICYKLLSLMPWSPKLVIFVPTMDVQTNYFTLYACGWGTPICMMVILHLEQSYFIGENEHKCNQSGPAPNCPSNTSSWCT